MIGNIVEKKAPAPKALSSKLPLGGFPTAVSCTERQKSKIGGTSMEYKPVHDVFGNISIDSMSSDEIKEALDEIKGLLSKKNIEFLMNTKVDLNDSNDTGNSEKLKWTVDPNQSSKATANDNIYFKNERFAFDGGKVVDMSQLQSDMVSAVASYTGGTRRISLGTATNVCASLLRPLFGEKYLHEGGIIALEFEASSSPQHELYQHELESASAGFTLLEALELFRSEYINQRILGMQLLHGILSKRAFLLSLEPYSRHLSSKNEASAIATAFNDAVRGIAESCSAAVSSDNDKSVRKYLAQLLIHHCGADQLPPNLPTALVWALQSWPANNSTLQQWLLRLVLAFVHSSAEEAACDELWQRPLAVLGLPMMPTPHMRRSDASYEEHWHYCQGKLATLFDEQNKADMDEGNASAATAKDVIDEFAVKCRWDSLNAFVEDGDMLRRLFAHLRPALWLLMERADESGAFSANCVGVMRGNMLLLGELALQILCVAARAGSDTACRQLASFVGDNLGVIVGAMQQRGALSTLLWKLLATLSQRGSETLRLVMERSGGCLEHVAVRSLLNQSDHGDKWVLRFWALAVLQGWGFGAVRSVACEVSGSKFESDDVMNLLAHCGKSCARILCQKRQQLELSSSSVSGAVDEWKDVLLTSGSLLSIAIAVLQSLPEEACPRPSVLHFIATIGWKSRPHNSDLSRRPSSWAEFCEESFKQSLLGVLKPLCLSLVEVVSDAINSLVTLAASADYSLDAAVVHLLSLCDSVSALSAAAPCLRPASLAAFVSATDCMEPQLALAAVAGRVVSSCDAVELREAGMQWFCGQFPGRGVLQDMRLGRNARLLSRSGVDQGVAQWWAVRSQLLAGLCWIGISAEADCIDLAGNITAWLSQREQSVAAEFETVFVLFTEYLVCSAASPTALVPGQAWESCRENCLANSRELLTAMQQEVLGAVPAENRCGSAWSWLRGSFPGALTTPFSLKFVPGIPLRGEWMYALLLNKTMSTHFAVMLRLIWQLETNRPSSNDASDSRKLFVLLKLTTAEHIGLWGCDPLTGDIDGSALETFRDLLELLLRKCSDAQVLCSRLVDYAQEGFFSTRKIVPQAAAPQRTAGIADFCEKLLDAAVNQQLSFEIHAMVLNILLLPHFPWQVRYQTWNLLGALRLLHLGEYAAVWSFMLPLHKVPGSATNRALRSSMCKAVCSLRRQEDRQFTLVELAIWQLAEFRCRNQEKHESSHKGFIDGEFNEVKPEDMLWFESCLASCKI